MAPFTVRYLARNGPSNLLPLMLGIQATRLLRPTEATTDPALSRTRNTQNRMPAHSLWATAVPTLRRTQACSVTALAARPAGCLSLVTKHPFSLAGLLLEA